MGWRFCLAMAFGVQILGGRGGVLIGGLGWILLRSGEEILMRASKLSHLLLSSSPICGEMVALSRAFTVRIIPFDMSALSRQILCTHVLGPGVHSPPIPYELQ